jgi:hypothetical protein
MATFEILMQEQLDYAKKDKQVKYFDLTDEQLSIMYSFGKEVFSLDKALTAKMKNLFGIDCFVSKMEYVDYHTNGESTIYSFYFKKDNQNRMFYATATVYNNKVKFNLETPRDLLDMAKEFLKEIEKLPKFRLLVLTHH